MRDSVDKKKSTNLDLKKYKPSSGSHQYIDDLSLANKDDSQRWINVGVDISEHNRAATFIQKDSSVIHSQARTEEIEMLSISAALEKYEWLNDYMWQHLSPDKDAYTAQATKMPYNGYFIHAKPGAKIAEPVQSCLYMSEDGAVQNVHNIVIAEENSEMHIITGCATASHAMSGLHLGVSEFYVKKGAVVHFTMIHDWGEKVNVRPRTAIHVEEGGVIVSNYISLRPVGSLEMNPLTILDGKGAVARFNSILVATHDSWLDVGSRVMLNHPDTRAEIISRGITAGGTIIARGELIGKVAGCKGHLECKGLILKDGLMHAIPELQGYVPGVDMSHEAAVGKIDQREIEYLMARGLDEDEAVSTIVRGFLNVQIEGLPPALAAEIDRAVTETQQDMM
ncbi:MAG TPA: SufD family Fe-S cluster assembly protein [Desulfosalsimonadaceae bacterium]|nr:SufD family Fe-S cluster assembly protein [Desulfosalsimonadaceae bacterium]